MENFELQLYKTDNKGLTVKIVCDKHCKKYERNNKHQKKKKAGKAKEHTSPGENTPEGKKHP